MADEVLDMIDRCEFSPVRVISSYDMTDVDGLLDRMSEARRRRQPLAALVAETQLRVGRALEGYKCSEVDELLTAILARVGEPDPRPAPSSAPNLPLVIEEQRGVFARIFGHHR